MRTRILLTVALTNAALLIACGDDTPKGLGSIVAVVEVTAGTAVITALGQTLQLAAVARDAAGNAISGQTFTWTSSNPSVATVDANGLATAVSNGQTTITAIAAAVPGSVVLTVSQAVATIEVTFSADTITGPGGTSQASAVAKDAGGSTVTGQTFTWNTDNPAVATVDTNGLITAVADGVANISAMASGLSGDATVTVRFAVVSVDVAPADDTLRAGSTVTLGATPRDGIGDPITGRAVSWTSSDDAVATVDVSGVVTGVNNGTATITADVEGVTGTADVHVWVGVTGMWTDTATTGIYSGGGLWMSLIEDLADAVSGNGRLIPGVFIDTSFTVVGTNNSGGVPDSVSLTFTVAGICSFTFEGNFDGNIMLNGPMNACAWANDPMSFTRQDITPPPSPVPSSVVSRKPDIPAGHPLLRRRSRGQ